MSAPRPLRVAIVAGEESGDLLGADLARALSATCGRPVELVGVGGRHLEALGLQPVFDASEIALMGVNAIIMGLPRLMRRIRQTADAIVRSEADCLVTIDSPEFSLRVAKRVRAAAPRIPIVHYVCPSVWAWRPGRAPAMKPYVDQVLCILPFEVEALRRLGGPPGTYVGHRLSRDAGVVRAAAIQSERNDLEVDRPRRLLILPGSRRSEVSRLLPVFGEIVSILRSRGNRLELTLPTVPHVAPMVNEMLASWEQKPEVTLEADAKWDAFGWADAAVIASGTVSLELALAGVPLVSCYKVDQVMRLARRMFISWSALLPNLIADRPIAPEFYDEFVRPEIIARSVEPLLTETYARNWQVDGFAEVRRRMRTDRPAGELAAGVVLDLIGRQKK
ncbi:MAG: lipid-A-disaccharide synthase [Rhizobiaceae bacterium]|nr:lipid-A-disaccharide synthase [Rhizobiaceae bacterium]